MSDPKNPLPQEAFRKKPVTDEDKFFAEQERKRLEALEARRADKKVQPRICLNADCQGQTMETLEFHGVEIDRCPKCGGVWLDPGELELLTSDKRTSKNPVVRFFHNLAGNYEE